MTIWLQKRLAVWVGVSLCGGALWWNVGASRAQSYSDAEVMKRLGKLTRNEAARMFVTLMHVEPKNGGNTYVNAVVLLQTVSPKSSRELGRYKAYDVIVEMMSQWKQLKRTTFVEGRSGKTAVVRIKNGSASFLPLILVEENGSWGVDVIETYAAWNHLQGVAKAEAIYKITGVVLDELPRTEKFKRDLCQSNLKQIALGMTQYMQDWDEKFPPSKSWIDALQPYVKSEAIFNCPALPKSKRYGYAYNSKMANQELQNFDSPAETTSVYETTILKRNAYGIGENRAFRHQNGANYAFADGHVKWFPKTATPSFKLKP